MSLLLKCTMRDWMSLQDGASDAMSTSQRLVSGGRMQLSTPERRKEAGDERRGL